MLRLVENDAWLTIVLPSETKERLRVLAARQGTSMSAVLRDVLEITLDSSSWDDSSKPEKPPERPVEPSPFARAARAVRAAEIAAR